MYLEEEGITILEHLCLEKPATCLTLLVEFVELNWGHVILCTDPLTNMFLKTIYMNKIWELIVADIWMVGGNMFQISLLVLRKEKPIKKIFQVRQNFIISCFYFLIKESA